MCRHMVRWQVFSQVSIGRPGFKRSSWGPQHTEDTPASSRRVYSNRLFSLLLEVNELCKRCTPCIPYLYCRFFFHFFFYCSFQTWRRDTATDWADDWFETDTSPTSSLSVFSCSGASCKKDSLLLTWVLPVKNASGSFKTDVFFVCLFSKVIRLPWRHRQDPLLYRNRLAEHEDKRGQHFNYDSPSPLHLLCV